MKLYWGPELNQRASENHRKLKANTAFEPPLLLLPHLVSSCRGHFYQTIISLWFLLKQSLIFSIREQNRHVTCFFSSYRPHVVFSFEADSPHWMKFFLELNCSFEFQGNLVLFLFFEVITSHSCDLCADCILSLLPWHRVLRAMPKSICLLDLVCWFSQLIPLLELKFQKG